MRMKNCVLGGIFLALISPNLSWTTGYDKESLNNKLPLQVSEFYEDYNFVSSYSTKSERSLLIKCFSLKELPDSLKSKRLDRVFELMKKLLQNQHPE
jgi:ABC-type sulfate transport system permease subunit